RLHYQKNDHDEAVHCAQAMLDAANITSEYTIRAQLVIGNVAKDRGDADAVAASLDVVGPLVDGKDPIIEGAYYILKGKYLGEMKRDGLGARQAFYDAMRSGMTAGNKRQVSHALAAVAAQARKEDNWPELRLLLELLSKFVSPQEDQSLCH